MVIGQSRSAVIDKLLLFTFFYILPSSDGTHPCWKTLVYKIKKAVTLNTTHLYPVAKRK